MFTVLRNLGRCSADLPVSNCFDMSVKSFCFSSSSPSSDRNDPNTLLSNLVIVNKLIYVVVKLVGTWLIC